MQCPTPRPPPLTYWVARVSARTVRKSFWGVGGRSDSSEAARPPPRRTATLELNETAGRGALATLIKLREAQSGTVPASAVPTCRASARCTWDATSAGHSLPTTLDLDLSTLSEP